MKKKDEKNNNYLTKKDGDKIVKDIQEFLEEDEKHFEYLMDLNKKQWEILNDQLKLMSWNIKTTPSK
ncbi:MAG: hypothetical protein WCT19_02855 [Candidatus Paceibacterota bacterium]|jgi:hypothetical protein